jgi:peroxiredoxin
VSDQPTFTHRPERRGMVGPFSGRQLGLAVLAVVLTAIVLVAVTTPLGNTGSGPNIPDPRATPVVFASPTEGLAIGQLAPEFTVDLPDGRYQLTDLDGRPIRLADLRGKAVWLNFWASWCPPCQQETPILRQIAREYEDRGLAVVGIEVQETVEDGRRYVERYGIPYRIGADVSGHVFRAYRVFALPTQFFIDADGVVRGTAAVVTLETARAWVESILPDAGASGNVEPSGAPSSR